MPRLSTLLLLLLLASLTLPLGGCSCRQETPAEQAAREAKKAEEDKRKLEEERAKRDVLLTSPTVLPGSLQAPSLIAKPGHWNAVTQPIQANSVDFDGVLSQGMVDRKGVPLLINRTPFRLTSQRPVVLAQKTVKQVDTLFYCPTLGETKQLRTTARDRRSGALKHDASIPLRPLLDHQYHFVVLAKEPARYAFLDSLYAVTSTLPQSLDTSTLLKGGSGLNAAKNYRVIAPSIADSSHDLLLPDNPLAWTSIAYVLWDEVDPQQLRAEQREALVDWINWGGQLIVNGPDSLDLLRGSFLEPLLPATGEGAREITATDQARIQAAWAVSEKPDAKPLKSEHPWSGVTLAPVADARSLPGLQNLLVERRVGRGRIVVSGFQLAQIDLINWSAGIENLYNAAILRRPPRRFVPGTYDGDKPVTLWLDKPALSLDPLLNTKVRFFVRDAYEDNRDLALKITAEAIDPTAGLGLPPQQTPGRRFLGRRAVVNSSFQQISLPKLRGGAGAWADHNLTANAARDALRRSAGVTVPDASFVAGWLAAYLLLLVPLNWGLFHALGRVELAWVAAPILAILGTLAVVKQAQLDIGFVRAQTEIAILELQPETPRAALTRFTALYTSLSTTYDLEFDSATAIASPFSRLGLDDPYRDDRVSEVIYERQEKSRLLGLKVSSASTEFVRSEAMLDISQAVPKGSSRVGKIAMGVSRTGVPRIENLTEWPIASVVVVQRPDGVDGPAQLEGCWVGKLPAGKSATVAFTPVAATPDTVPFAAQRIEEATIGGEAEDQLDLEALFALALDPERFEPGERRIVGRIDLVLPGMTIHPAASQRHGATLIVGHLAYGPLPPSQSDKNAPTDVTRKN